MSAVDSNTTSAARALEALPPLDDADLAGILMVSGPLRVSQLTLGNYSRQLGRPALSVHRE